MQKATFFPPLQSTRFFPYNKAISPAYNYRHLDERYPDTIRPNQIYAPYAQKVQYTDPVNIYVLTTATMITGGSIVVSIHDANGVQKEILDTINGNLGGITFLPSAIYSWPSEEGTIYTGHAWIYKFYFANDSYSEGQYYVKVTVLYSDDTTEEFVSEMIWLRTKHKGTVALDYTNSENDYDILFEQFPILFRRRFNSDFMYLEPMSESTMYADQGQNIRKLYDVPYRAYKLSLGANSFGAKGMPEYDADLANRIFACDKFKVEKKRLTKNEGAKIEQTRFENYPLQTLTVELREYFNQGAGNFVQDEVILAITPNTQPYMIVGFGMTDGTTRVYIEVQYMKDGTSETAFLSLLNGYLKSFYDLQGDFVKVGTTWKYLNGDGENFSALDCRILTTYLQLTVDVAATGPFNWGFYQGTMAVSYGDEPVDPIKVYTSSIPNTILNVTKNFTTTSQKIVQMFFDDQQTVISLGNANISPIKNTIKAITGNVSSKLGGFQVNGADLYNGGVEHDISYLSRANNTLQQIVMMHSNIVGFDASWAPSGTVGNPPNVWPQLKYFYLEFNKITSANVNDLILAIYGNIAYKPAGMILLDGQNPAAPPTNPATLLVIPLMINQLHWTIITD